MLNVTVLLKFYKGEISLFDSAAIECALRTPNAVVTLVAMAPLSCSEPLKQLTRLGCNRAILISDPKYAGSDTLATSKVLAKALEKLKPDLVLCGRQSMDGDTAQVPSQVATLLGYSIITNALEFNLDSVETRLGKRKVTLPSVISVEKIMDLRFPSFRSKPIDIEVWDNEILNLSDDDCGVLGSYTKVLKVYEKQSSERKCKFVSIKDLPKIIRDSTLIKNTGLDIKESSTKLSKILIVGEGLTEEANAIANEIVRIDDGDALTIANEIKRLSIKHVLFKASLKNRSLAPQVSAILNCGLAADCIGLETDGENLFVYRPANSDKVVAKIGYLSDVQMATIRSVDTGSADVIFSIGYGAKDYVDKITRFANKYGAAITSSRKVVDCGFCDYEKQVGLTGKIVCPKVYVAFGICGAIQHVVGMENSTTIIAINKDKDAKIFDYADYGVTEDIKDVEL